MFKRISFLDILKIPEFSHLNQFDLLHRGVDSDVAPILWVLGFDIDKGLRIQASRHRTLDLQEVVGYSYICLERSDKDWLANSNCSMSARIHAQPDDELQNDMVRMSVEGLGEKGFRNMCLAAIGKEGTTRVVKKEWNETMDEDYATIIALQNIQRDVRGCLHVDEDIFQYAVIS